MATPKIERVGIKGVFPNPDNPRLIKDDSYAKLLQSIKDFPQMLEIRPIVVNKDMMVLGGNMRLAACKEAGMKEIPIIRADKLTKEQQEEFMIKDNIAFGDWDTDVLANKFDIDDLVDWGMDKLDFGLGEGEEEEPKPKKVIECPKCGHEFEK